MTARAGTLSRAFRDYSREVLSFAFTGPEANRDAPLSATIPADEARAAQRLNAALRALARSGKERLALVGLGQGRLPRDLALALGPHFPLVACETDPALGRRLLFPGSESASSPGDAPMLPDTLAALVDASPWAHLLLLALCGFDASNTLILRNPESDPPTRQDKSPAAVARHSLQRLFAAHSRREIPLFGPIRASSRPTLSVAAILDPTEPDLASFFRQLAPAPDQAPWYDELVLIWDATEVPNLPIALPQPIRQFARPLNRDFAAQRGAMLAACATDWVLYLDADEELGPLLVAALPALLAQEDLAGYAFPRATLYPDADHCKVGYGLWPDLQLRLFRNQPGLTFERPIHERLTGLDGAVGLVAHPGIAHYSRLRKDPSALRAKLGGFDAAAGGQVRHHLSEEYPSLPLRYFRDLAGAPDADVQPQSLSVLVPVALGRD